VHRLDQIEEPRTVLAAVEPVLVLHVEQVGIVRVDRPRDLDVRRAFVLT
jgi:hypothetical protein